MQFQKAAAHQVLSMRETINEALVIKTAHERHQVIQTGRKANTRIPAGFRMTAVKLFTAALKQCTEYFLPHPLCIVTSVVVVIIVVGVEVTVFSYYSLLLTVGTSDCKTVCKSKVQFH